MARHLLLSLTTAFQIGAVDEEAHRGVSRSIRAMLICQLAVLPGQAARADALRAFPGDPQQGTSTTQKVPLTPSRLEPTRARTSQKQNSMNSRR